MDKKQSNKGDSDYKQEYAIISEDLYQLLNSDATIKILIGMTSSLERLSNTGIYVVDNSKQAWDVLEFLSENII